MLRIYTLFALALMVPSAARAYCQLTTDQPVRSACPEACITTGEPVSWPDHDILYTFNQDMIPDLDDATTRRIFEQSFGAWTEVDCDEALPIDLRLDQDPNTTDVAVAEHTDNINVIVYRGPQEWAALHPASSRAFALTQVWYRTDNGDVVGADMELNGSLGTYRECPDEGCAPGGDVDLGNVVTHEAGHFLGLAHSEVRGSTMYCDAEPWEVDKRTLEDDDAAGICSIYGSVDVEGIGSESRNGSMGGGGCQSLPARPSMPGNAGLLAFTLWGLCRRRMRG